MAAWLKLLNFGCTCDYLLELKSELLIDFTDFVDCLEFRDVRLEHDEA